MGPMMARDPSTAADSLRTTIATLANELLDAFYADVPQANAFGTDYERPGTGPDGVFYLGREHGADGADDEVGFDYFYRKFRDPESRQQANEYVYPRFGGWPGVNILLSDAALIRQVFAKGVEEGYLEEGALETYDEVVETASDRLWEIRQEYDLSTIAALLRDAEIDTLRPLLATGDEEGETLWKLLFSKDESGETITNSVDVPVVSERDQFLFARAERYYYDDAGNEGSHYAYGVVIGYDDTPERFFVHRIESDPDLRDPETEWTPALVRQKMGFDVNLHEVDPTDLPIERIVRLQGDLAVVRHDVGEAKQNYTDQVRQHIREQIAHNNGDALGEAFSELGDVHGIRLRLWAGPSNVTVLAAETSVLKERQEKIGIEEETVRTEQDRQGYMRLTANRRQEILEDLLQERVVQWAVTHDDDWSAERVDRVVADKVRRDFNAIDGQINNVLGNHTLVLGSVTVHPSRTYGDDSTLAAYVVPENEQTTGFILHDEHENKRVTFGPGVYEFRFLTGHEDEWWMDT